MTYNTTFNEDVSSENLLPLLNKTINEKELPHTTMDKFEINKFDKSTRA